MLRSFIIIFLLFGVLVYSQNSDKEIQKKFAEAVSYYNASNLNSAEKIFNDIYRSEKFNSRTTAAAYFISKIYLAQKKYAAAEDICRKSIANYPGSSYRSYFYDVLIKSLIDSENYKDAFDELLNIISSDPSAVNRIEKKEIAENLALNNFSAEDIQKFYLTHPEKKLTPFLLLTEAKILQNENDNTKADQIFGQIVNNYPDSEEYFEALTLKGKGNLNVPSGKFPLVGVMLSLTDQTGNAIPASEEILEGIKYAFNEYNSGRDDKIGLVIEDLQKSEDRIKSVTEKFAYNPDIRSILGPVFSDEVRLALNELGSTRISVISPTATDEDLTQLSENFFQANPSFTQRGKTLAQYLYYVEGRRRLAVLSSIDSYSPLLSASFVTEFERLGGNILIRETYKSKNPDISDQVSRIAGYKDQFEGLYVPLSDKNDATFILSNLVKNEIITNLYGSQDWLLAKGFETSPQLSNNLVFDSDYFIDFNDQKFKEFSSSFREITGREVNRNVLYGFDAAKYLITIMRNIDPSRLNIINKMKSGVKVSGFHNNISFDSDRVNKYINILRYKDGIFELIDKFRAGGS